MRGILSALALATVVACSQTTFDPAPQVIHARFDPEAGVIPMPTDILRDDDAGRLDLPIDEADTDAERELFEYLNTLDGWSSASSATVEFTGPINVSTATPDVIEVWHMRATPTRVDDVRLSWSDDETELTIDAPREGWERGGNYVVVVRGGQAGLEGKSGERVEADAAFYFLRLTEKLDGPEHERAFPGATADERRENARDLEEIRLELAPHFEFFEQRGVERREIAALFSFTVTERVELAMDKASQRLPFPVNLMLDPETERIDLPPAPWDSEVVLEVKEKLGELDGFGTSAKLLFGFTGEINPATVSSNTVRLFDMSGAAPVEIAATIEVLADGRHIEVEPTELPLAEKSQYALAVTSDLRDIDGEEIIAMPLGHLLQIDTPIVNAENKSELDQLDDDEAARVERVRGELQPLWSQAALVDRDRLIGAWTFKTMAVAEPLAADLARAAAAPTSLHPKDVERMSPGQAVADFPLAIASLLAVEDVYTGTIETADFLDPRTRAFRGDGDYEIRDIHFTMTVPDAAPGATVPVVIFGHGVMTERRFVLAIGDALAARGFAAISIDLPYHGERTHCFAEGPLSIPNPQTGELVPLGDPCAGGAVCMEEGVCRNPDGSLGELAKWPIIGMYRSSGAAYLEIEKIANTRDHFRQSLFDLAALRRSLAGGDWLRQVGVHFDENNIYYAGQSLGGIVGATFVSVEPTIKRAVLNVPGADTVDLFRDSPFFGGQIEAFFTREGVEPASYDGHRFLNVARWLMDAVDPQSFSSGLIGRDVMLQMATLDFIIPNAYTERLAELTGLPQRNYIGEHGFLVIPIEPAYLRGTFELAEFLEGDFTP